jgi:hypothetical protein
MTTFLQIAVTLVTAYCHTVLCCHFVIQSHRHMHMHSLCQSSYCHTVKLSYCHFVILSYCHTVKLSYCHLLSLCHALCHLDYIIIIRTHNRNDTLPHGLPRMKFGRSWSYLRYLLCNATSRRRSWKVDWKNCDMHRLAVTIWSSVSFVGLVSEQFPESHPSY